MRCIRCPPNVSIYDRIVIPGLVIFGFIVLVVGGLLILTLLVIYGTVLYVHPHMCKAVYKEIICSSD